MIIRRARGQEREDKRTVGKREPGTRPRVDKGESTARDQGRRPFSSRPDTREPLSGKRVGKLKVIKTASGSKPAPINTNRYGKERTSDVFRRDVIGKTTARKFEGAESD